MTSVDRSGDAFRRALDEARSCPQRRADERGSPNRSASLGVRLDFGPERGGGGAARWGLAMDWADAPPPRALAPLARACAPAPAAADSAEAVARELGFAVGMATAALTARWRAFVWRNHPDRQPAEMRERANARVAVANALYDRARHMSRRA